MVGRLKRIFENTGDCASRRSWGYFAVQNREKAAGCYVDASPVEWLFRSYVEASRSGS